MKLRKFLGGFLLGLGCAVTLVGLLAATLPLIDNDQLRLVLSSFEMPSQNIVVNALNAAMTYALANCYLVMLFGAIGIGVGLLLMLRARADEPNESYEPPRPARPRPAYTVAQDESAAQTAPVWSARVETAEANPFADASLAAMLAPKAAIKASESTASNPFAPTPLLGDEPPQDTPYQRPESTPREPYEARTDAYKPPVSRVETAPAPEAYAPPVSQSPSVPQVLSMPPAPPPLAPVSVPERKPDAEIIYRSPSLHASESRIRSTFRPADFKPDSAREPRDEVAAPEPAPSEPQAVSVPASSRIKSTMGRHS